MKKAYLISTGTELLIGSTIDTNSVFLSEKLLALGIRVTGKSTIGDLISALARPILSYRPAAWGPPSMILPKRWQVKLWVLRWN